MEIPYTLCFLRCESKNKSDQAPLYPMPNPDSLGTRGSGLFLHRRDRRAAKGAHVALHIFHAGFAALHFGVHRAVGAVFGKAGQGEQARHLGQFIPKADVLHLAEKAVRHPHRRILWKFRHPHAGDVIDPNFLRACTNCRITIRTPADGACATRFPYPPDNGS